MSILELKYKESLLKLKSDGFETENRTGINTKQYINEYFKHDCSANTLPLILGKFVSPKLPLIEMLWFMLGRTDKDFLNDRNVNYWNSWFTEENNYDIGKTYGYQFRNGKKDQLFEAINDLIYNENSRRIIIDLWNHNDLDDMYLPPCVMFYQFNVTNNVVDLSVMQRSCDSFLGVPYDFMLAWWLLNLSVNIANLYRKDNKLKVGNIHYMMNNYHLYVNHEQQINKYIENSELLNIEKYDVAFNTNIFESLFLGVADLIGCVNFDSIELTNIINKIDYNIKFTDFKMKYYFNGKLMFNDNHIPNTIEKRFREKIEAKVAI